MSTAIINIDETWQNIQAGPQAAVSISSISRKIYYQLVPTAPAAQDRGHVLGAGEGIGLALTGSDNLWVRTTVDVNAQVAVTL